MKDTENNRNKLKKIGIPAAEGVPHPLHLFEEWRNIMFVAKNLTKQYKAFTAVDHLNLTVLDGAVFGFLGHNGV